MDAPRLLLLNTTNHLIRIAYPYAFVQVSEVARRHGIQVRRVDLHGVAWPHREEVLRRHIRQFAPSMIGITLRNTDSLLSTDYMRASDDARYEEPVRLNLLEKMTQGLPPYHPTHDTRALIDLLRRITPTPLIVGGFGFSAQPSRTMEFLKPDFGVVGDPEPVLSRFEDLLRGKSLESISNLCYFEDGTVRINDRIFHGPSPNREYVDEIVLDRNQFFGMLGSQIPATSRAIPIEVMRGCPYLCTFCAEPRVKGNRAQLRDLDVVAAELEFLRGHGLNQVWFICSEINAMGNGFALELAERVIRINEQRPEAERVRWFTYYLLRFTLPELRLLRRSGFLGGWNDIPAFDDKNLKRLRVPYRSRHLLQSIKDVITVGREEAATRSQPQPSLEERIVFDPDHRKTLLPDDMLTSPVLTLFLGNQLATVETVRETLQVMDRELLATHFDAAFVIRGERVFEYNQRSPQRAGEASAATRSFPPPGSSAATAWIDPTFGFPEPLLQQLGSLEQVEQFFSYIEDTFLSQNHLFRKDWCWFLGTRSSIPEFRAWWLQALSKQPRFDSFTGIEQVRRLLEHVAEDPSPDRIGLLFFPAPGRKPIAAAAADAAIRVVLEGLPEARLDVLKSLGIPADAAGQPTLSPYGTVCRLFASFRDTDELRRAVSTELSGRETALHRFALADFLYRNGIELRAEYRPFFVADEYANVGRDSALPAAAAGAT